jgi:hypothetical protein
MPNSVIVMQLSLEYFVFPATQCAKFVTYDINICVTSVYDAVDTQRHTHKQTFGS